MASRLWQLLKFRRRRAGADAKPTFFLHIPKCAGSTLWEVILDIYGTRDVFLATNKARRTQFTAMPVEQRRGYSGVGGHGSLRFFRDMLGDLDRYHKIVTLRDPIERLISEYNYVRAHPRHPRHAAVAAQDFETFAVRTAKPNRQVKLLTGSPEDSAGAIDIVTRFFDDWSMSEDVEAMAARLYEVTGTPPRPTAHKNKSRPAFRRSDMDPAALRRLEELNRHDLALCEALGARRSR